MAVNHSPLVRYHSDYNELSVHRHEELLVALGTHHTVVDSVHGLNGVHVADILTQYPHTVKCGAVLKQVIASGA